MNTKPVIFKNKQDVPGEIAVIEAFDGAIEELFFIQHPHFKKAMPEAQEALAAFKQSHTIPDVWIYYPGKQVVVHAPNEDDYFILRTARNRNIITAQEQEQYRNCVVGIAGLSVGSSALPALVLSGGPKHIAIADYDTLEITNLNRIRGTLLDIGKNKTEVAADNVWSLDPYAELTLFADGLTKDSLPEFISGTKPLDIFIDEMDSIDLKILSRLHCKEKRIPVLMATDNGDSVILDVERYDEEPDREIFHGLIGHMEPADVAALDFSAWLKLATQIVGPEYLTERMQDSLMAIGQSIASVPQLGTTASVAGAAIAFAVRQIATGAALPSGRYAFGLDSALIPDYNSDAAVAARAQKTENFKQAFAQRGKK